MAQAAVSLEDLLLEKWEKAAPPPPISVKVELVYDELEEIFRSAVATPKRKAVGDVLVPVVSKKRRDHPRRSSVHYPDTLNTQKRFDYPNGEFMVLFGGFVFHELLQYIKQATLVVGCLYSATHHQFFDALSNRKGVKLVMHKSDWAYTDSSNQWIEQREGLRTLPLLPMDAGVVDPDPRNAVVCVGESQTDNPRKDACLMHRKFLVFLNEENAQLYSHTRVRFTADTREQQRGHFRRALARESFDERCDSVGVRWTH